MTHKQRGFISFATMTLLIGGLALIGLLLYGAQSGHELPLWPAIVVILVNVFASYQMVREARQAKRRRETSPPPDKRPAARS